MKCSLLFEDCRISLVDLTVPTFNRVTLFKGDGQPKFARFGHFFLHRLYFFSVTFVALGVLRDVIGRQLSVFAIDSQLLGDLTDALDGPRLTLRDRLGSGVSMLLSYVNESVARQVAACPARLARDGVSGFQHDDAYASSD